MQLKEFWETEVYFEEFLYYLFWFVFTDNDSAFHSRLWESFYKIYIFSILEVKNLIAVFTIFFHFLIINKEVAKIACKLSRFHYVKK